MDSRRTFNTLVREPWNPCIHQILRAIDNHVSLHLKTGEQWHLDKAEFLRCYLRELKDWIKEEEGIT